MAQIQKGTTYSTGDQVTATNLNALADAAILLPGAITDQTAKTVPLAADTVLIHSAADTALRKSTLTQLFSNATGIPLTTGVTGVLPAANGGTGVNNGANTITIAGNVTHAGAFTQTFTATANTSLTLPVSGTLSTLAGSEALSNKTITASAFNGTVGATTPSTVAATTITGTDLTLSGQLFLGSNSNQILNFATNNLQFGAGAVWNGSSWVATATSAENITLGSSGIQFRLNTGLTPTNTFSFTTRGTIDANGFQGAIGATTASTGAFTTLSASGTVTLSGSGAAITAGTTTGYGVFQNSNGRSGIIAYGQTHGTYPDQLELFAGNAAITRISSTGLAVTGALSSTTGANFATSSGNVGIGTTSPAVKLHVQSGSAGATALRLTDAVRGTINIDFPATSQIRFDVGASEKTLFSSGTNTILTINDNTSGGGIAVTGAMSCTGALSKGSGSFRIEHPLPAKSATHQLVHSFIEGPQADLIYRGKVVLVYGKASVNIDAASTMTEGTFEVLCRDVQCFTTNETGWTVVRGKVTGNILTIEAKDADCADEISWMVIGERQDPHMMETDWTDDNGKVIVEPLKPVIETSN